MVVGFSMCLPFTQNRTGFIHIMLLVEAGSLTFASSSTILRYRFKYVHRSTSADRHSATLHLFPLRPDPFQDRHLPKRTNNDIVSCLLTSIQAFLPHCLFDSFC